MSSSIISSPPPEGYDVYMLLTSANKDELNHKVCEALRMGYRLQGSPVINQSTNRRVYFAQAVYWPGVYEAAEIPDNA